MIAPVVVTRPIPVARPSVNQASAADGRESERLASLHSYGIPDGKPDPSFDDLVLIAARLCQAPMALIGFMDSEQFWVKAQLGLKLDAVPREYALYGATDSPRLEEIPDTLPDSRLHDHPMVILWPKIRYYVGTPIVMPDGHLVGVLEVMDRVPRKLDPQQLEGLAALVRQVVVLLDLNRVRDEHDNAQQARRIAEEIGAAFDLTLESMARALDLRDREVDGHLARVAQITVSLARAMGVPYDHLVHIRRGALLHDIGKMGIPDGILLKPSALNDEEWEVMHLHPTYAYEMLSPIELLRPALDIPHCHHERWDGQGYPRGLRHEEIPLAARIFSVVDVWDALRSDRPYRPGWPEPRVRDYIGKRAGADFDPAVVEQFLKLPM